MIILFITIFAVLTFYGFMFSKRLIGRVLIGGISFILLAVSVGLLTLHIDQNWGMKEVTKTTSHEIFTAGEISAPYGMMIKSELGKNTDNYVLIYRTYENESKAEANFVPNANNIVDTVKKSGTYRLVDATTARIVTTTTRRQFKSNLMSFLFSVGGEQNELVKQRSVVEVPRDTWIVLTEAQAEQLQKEAPAMQKQQEEILQADPAKAQEMAEMKKHNPEAFAKLQVTQMKQLLGIKD